MLKHNDLNNKKSNTEHTFNQDVFYNLNMGEYINRTIFIIMQSIAFNINAGCLCSDNTNKKTEVKKVKKNIKNIEEEIHEYLANDGGKCLLDDFNGIGMLVDKQMKNDKNEKEKIKKLEKKIENLRNSHPPVEYENIHTKTIETLEKQKKELEKKNKIINKDKDEDKKNKKKLDKHEGSFGL
jgi:hypothetical protein